MAWKSSLSAGRYHRCLAWSDPAFRGSVVAFARASALCTYGSAESVSVANAYSVDAFVKVRDDCSPAEQETPYFEELATPSRPAEVTSPSSPKP